MRRLFKSRNFVLSPLIGCSAIFAGGPKLSLEEALDQALLKNRSYLISDLEAKTSAEQVSWGRSGLLPKVDLTALQTRSLVDSRQERAGTGIEEKFGAKSTNTSVGIVGSWTIFEGLSSLAIHDKLEAQAQSMSERRAQMRQDIAGQLIMAYTDVVRQKTVLAAMDSIVLLSRERVKITESKYSLGSLSKLELLQAKLDLNEDISVQLKQSALLANARHYLNRILARTDTTVLEVDDSISLASLSDSLSLKSKVIDASPELGQAAQGRNLASAAYREYRGRLFPQLGLSLGYNYGLTKSDAGFIKSNELLGWNYGVNLKWNIFDGFVLPSDYRAARAFERRADLAYEDSKSRLEMALAQSQENYRTSLEVLALEKANRGLAGENVSIAMERLRLGTIASLELRTAQEKFLAAETRLIATKFECKRAETEWLRLAGRLAPGHDQP